MKTTPNLPAFATRRAFLLAASAVPAAALARPRLGLAGSEREPGPRDDGPSRPRPIAISGDAEEPKWDEKQTITVSARDRGPDADIVGSTDKAIQAAVDFLARRGEGGTVRILDGAYRLRNSIFLPSKIRIQGEGEATILIKEPSAAAKLVVDSDWYDQEITLADPKEFRIGDGVCLRAKNPHTNSPTVIKRTLVGRSGNRFRLDRSLRENLWMAGDPTASTLFPLLTGEFVSDIVIENLTLDGNRSHNDNLDGNYSGCIFFQDCNRIAIRNIVARNQNGDGVSWQICHDVTVEHCRSVGHAGLGLHPGSGSQRPIMRDNVIENNDIGIFFCWGVRFGVAERNQVIGNKCGVSIGHRDTDNLVRDNVVRDSGQVGILFRDESKSFGPHRNRIENNRILNSGPADGVGIDVRGETESVVIARNEIRETRAAMKRIGVRVGPKTRGIELVENQIEGHSQGVVRQA